MADSKPSIGQIKIVRYSVGSNILFVSAYTCARSIIHYILLNILSNYTHNI
jgi:hypothetical protein